MRSLEAALQREKKKVALVQDVSRALSEAKDLDMWADRFKAYAEGHFHVVESLTDKDGKPAGMQNGKPAYDEFFYEALVHLRSHVEP